jgi:BON domain
MNNDSALTQEMAITAHVQQALRTNTTTARYPIEVAVQGATVSLHGAVDSQEAKDTAEQLTRSVPGVVAVTNELTIDQDAGKEAGGLGVGRDREGGIAVPAAIGGLGTGGGQGGPAYPGAPLAAAELAGTTENVPPEEGEKSGP